MRSSRWLVLFPVVWAACGGGGSGSSTTTSSDAATTTSASATTSTSTSGTGGSSTSTTSGTGGTGGSGGATTSTTSSTSSTGTGGTGGGDAGLSGTRVRIAAANLTSGNNQSYDPGPGMHILGGVHADIVLMQEMNYGDNSTTALRALVDGACGTACDFTRGSGMIPNAVLSRYPILESGTWTDASVSNRDFTWAHIDVPGPIDLWAVSVHLLTTNPTLRDTEASSIVQQIQANVPAGDYVVVGGDFNTDVRAEPCITTFDAVLSTASPYPADGNGNDKTSGPRTRPYDWVLVSSPLRAREAPVAIGAAQFATGLVVDTRIYTPIADLAPALVGDSGAPNMQHMAVVRDFLLE